MLGFVLNRADKPADSLKTYTAAARLTTPKSAELRAAVALSPQDPKLHYDLGRAYRAAGKMEQAKEELALSAKLYGAKDSAGPQ